ncbi:YpiF family protein [Bacillus sp. FSL W7-1360]
MRFRTDDMDTYLQSKDYVDTMMIPLVQVTWQQDAKRIVQAAEFLALLAGEVERQFHGRMMYCPGFTYASMEAMNDHVERLNKWREEMNEAGFKHILLLTTDTAWKEVESSLSGMKLLFVAPLPLESLAAQDRQEMLSQQVRTLLPTLMEVWQ